jgi:hypothetical protein
MIGIDLAKHVFQLHGSAADGTVLFRRKLRREKLLDFLAAQPACVVAMEACASAHYWGREIGRLGHEVRLVAPAYVKPFVKRQKNDTADAEAICEAAGRPTMRFVAVKSETQQASAQNARGGSSRPAICWFASGRRRSMPCVVTWPNSVSSRRKGLPMSADCKPSSRMSRPVYPIQPGRFAKSCWR